MINHSHRQLLGRGGFALFGAGFLSRMDKVAAMQQSHSSLTEVVKNAAIGTSEKLLLQPTPGEEGPPQPSAADRLPIEWTKQTARRFTETLAKHGVEALLRGERL